MLQLVSCTKIDKGAAVRLLTCRLEWNGDDPAVVKVHLYETSHRIVTWEVGRQLMVHGTQQTEWAGGVDVSFRQAHKNSARVEMRLSVDDVSDHYLLDRAQLVSFLARTLGVCPVPEEAAVYDKKITMGLAKLLA